MLKYCTIFYLKFERRSEDENPQKRKEPHFFLEDLKNLFLRVYSTNRSDRPISGAIDRSIRRNGIQERPAMRSLLFLDELSYL
jgi:hypothetical protein